MVTEDAVNIKEKLEEVLIVIDEYGKQAKQFSETRNDLIELVKKFSTVNDAFADTVINSDEFLKSAQKLIDIDYVSKVQEKVNEISKLEVTHQEKCDSSLTRIESLAESFELKANDLVSTQNLLLQKSDALFEKVEELARNVELERESVLERISILETNLMDRLSEISQLFVTYDNVKEVHTNDQKLPENICENAETEITEPNIAD